MSVVYYINYYIFDQENFTYYSSKPLMKLKLTILAVIILAMSACTQRTCPTYAQEDTQEQTTPSSNV